MKYPAYPDTKNDEQAGTGLLPDHWHSYRLKFLVELRNEKVDAEVSDLPYMGLEHIESWTCRKLDDEEASAEGIASRYLPGDVLFGKLRPYLAKVYLSDHEGLASTEALVMTPGHRLASRFLKYLLVSSRFVGLVSGASYGSKMPRASWDHIGSITAAVPTIVEQKKIASFLDWRTGQIDALIAKKNALIKKLQEDREAVIRKAISEGLDRTKAFKDAGVRWLGRVPEHWSISRIKFVAEIASGHTPSRSVDEYWQDCTIPWVSLNDSKTLRERDYISETHYQISELGLANSSARLLPAGVVVFSRDATVGLCAITEVPMAVSQHFIAYICGEKLLPTFLLLVLKAMQQHLQSLQTGSTIVTIGMPEIRGLETPLPPLEEQRAIVKHIDDECASLDGSLRLAKEAIEKLTEYRSALITAAVTGQIDVRGVPVPVPV